MGRDQGPASLECCGLRPGGPRAPGRRRDTGGEDLRSDGDGWAVGPGAGQGDADSVELKILLDADPDVAARALTGRHTLRWRVRQMHLLDTPELALARAGLEMRLRRRVKGRHDLTVRARRPWLVPSPHPSPRPPEGARVELDVLPGSVWRTTELRRELDPAQAADWMTGRLPPGRLISTEQADWARRCLGRDRAERLVTRLVVHGPLVVHRLRVPGDRFPTARARLEACRYPSGRGLVELSARCRPARAPVVAAAIDDVLRENGLAVADCQRTKTALWLDDLARTR